MSLGNVPDFSDEREEGVANGGNWGHATVDGRRKKGSSERSEATGSL